jgi:hypothetical protein
LDGSAKPARRGIVFSSDVVDHSAAREAENQRAAMEALQADRDRQARGWGGIMAAEGEDTEVDVVAFAEALEAGGSDDGEGCGGAARTRGRSRSLVQH